MHKLILWSFLALPLFIATESHAGEVANFTPISLGLVPPAQFPSPNFTVNGIRLTGIYGISRRVRGLDIGLLGNSTDEEFSGIGISGLMNLNHGTTKIIGLQLAAITNINKGAGKVYGFQISLANLSKFSDIYGIQLGLYNRARVVRGLQIGIVNYTTNLIGVQIGLANFNEGGPFGVSPLINAGW